MRQKFIAANDSEARNRWYRHCANEGIPFVTVTKRRKYAKVEFDRITLPSATDDAFDAQRARLDAEFLTMFSRIENQGCRFQFGFYGFIDNLQVDAAHVAAGEVFDILMSTEGHCE